MPLGVEEAGDFRENPFDVLRLHPLHHVVFDGKQLRGKDEIMKSRNHEIRNYAITK
jgi:hypothetical protein